MKLVITFCMLTESGEYYPVEYRYKDVLNPVDTALIALTKVRKEHPKDTIVDHRAEYHYKFQTYNRRGKMVAR